MKNRIKELIIEFLEVTTVVEIIGRADYSKDHSCLIHPVRIEVKTLEGTEVKIKVENNAKEGITSFSKIYDYSPTK